MHVTQVHCSWCRGPRRIEFYRGRRERRCDCSGDYRTPIEIRRDAVLEKYGNDPDAYTPAVLAELAKDGLFDIAATFCPAGKLTMEETRQRELSQILPTPDTHPKDGDVKQAPLGSGRKQVQIPPKEPSNDNDLRTRLLRRAEIRRQIPTRKSVQEGAPDRIADLLEEAVAALDERDAENARLYEHLLETQMLAHKWMEAHDKLHAGKPYSFPKPADLPDALAERDERIKALEAGLRLMVSNFIGFCSEQDQAAVEPLLTNPTPKE